jgi:serine/threonine-protein kinase RsbW
VTSLMLSADIRNLPRVIEMVSACAGMHGVTPERIAEMELVVEEAFANICFHGYPGGEGEAEISCFASDDDDRIVIQLTDSGMPFDMARADIAPPEGDLEHRRIGGLGVLFVRTMTDAVEYRREGGQNRLRLVFRLTNANGESGR